MRFVTVRLPLRIVWQRCEAMRSEFEKLLKQHRDSLTEELVKLGKHRQVQLVEWDIERSETDYEFYFDGAWNVQQSKIDELQKKNAWLSDVACRENKRANKLQEEKVNTTGLLGKTIQEKNHLQKQVDAVKILIEEYRDPPTEDKTFSHALSIVADELEQALKGGGE